MYLSLNQIIVKNIWSVLEVDIDQWSWAEILPSYDAKIKIVPRVVWDALRCVDPARGEPAHPTMLKSAQRRDDRQL